jgi:hypothetical protein
MHSAFADWIQLPEVVHTASAASNNCAQPQVKEPALQHAAVLVPKNPQLQRAAVSLLPHL